MKKHQEHECSDFWQKTKKEQHQEKSVIQEPDNLKDREQKVSEDGKLDRVLEKGDVGFKCKFCIETFENKDLQTNHIIEEHLKKGTKQDYFRCSFCNIFVLDEPNLLNHVAKDHAVEKGEIYRPYKCHSCPENTFFRYSHELKKHLEAHDKDNLLENIKKKGFQINPTNSVYVVKNPYKCHICDLSSKTKYLLDLHIKTVHNQRNQQTTSVTEMVDLKPYKCHKKDDVPEITDVTKMNNVTEAQVTCVAQITKLSGETYDTEITANVPNEMKVNDVAEYDLNNYDITFKNEGDVKICSSCNVAFPNIVKFHNHICLTKDPVAIQSESVVDQNEKYPSDKPQEIISNDQVKPVHEDKKPTKSHLMQIKDDFDEPGLKQNDHPGNVSGGFSEKTEIRVQSGARRRRVRCKTCEACSVGDCKKCVYCKKCV